MTDILIHIPYDNAYIKGNCVNVPSQNGHTNHFSLCKAGGELYEVHVQRFAEYCFKLGVEHEKERLRKVLDI